MTTPNPGAGPKETVAIGAGELVDHVKHLIHEGNVRRISIVHDGHTVMEIPVTIGVVGVLAAPWLAAVGAAAAVLTDCTIEVERDAPPPDAAPA